MAVGFVMTFDGVGQDEYEKAMEALELNSPGAGGRADEWPEGIQSHYAGPTPTGWCVVDIWASQEKFDAFLGGRLGPAMAKAGIPQPDVTPFEIYNSHT